MKKMILAMIILLSIVGILVTGAMVAAITNKEGLGMFRWGAGARELLLDESYEADALDKISLSLRSEEVNIYLTDSNLVQVKHYGQNLHKDRVVTVGQVGNELVVGRSSGVSPFPFLFFSRSWVEVYIPRSYNKILALTLSSGGIRINDALHLKTLTVKLSSGNINADAPITAKNADIDVTSGNITLQGGLFTNDYMIRVSSGNVSIGSTVSGSGSATVTSGHVTLAGVDIKEDLDIKVSSGRIHLTLADDPGLNFTGSVRSGTIKTYFETAYQDNNKSSLYAAFGSEPRKTLNIQVSSGTVEVEKG